MYNLYGMARQDWLLRRHPDSTTVRFEDLRHHFNATVVHILRQLGLVPDASGAEPLLSQLQECDPGTWKGARRKEDNHITAGKSNNSARLRGALLAHPDLRDRFCSLSTSLDYPAEGMCDNTAAAAGGAGEAMSDRAAGDKTRPGILHSIDSGQSKS